MLKNIFVFVVMLAVAVCGLGGYFLYRPKPPLPVEAAETHTLDVDGRQRTFSSYAPADLRAGAGVLLVLHPSGGSGDVMRRICGPTVEPMAARENFVVAYPDGFEGHFNDCRRAASYSARKLNIDDVGFIRRLIAQLVIEKQVDAGRVWALGYSNGGHMAMRLALAQPQVVQGIIAVAANLPAPENMDCRAASAPVRFITLIEGTQDPINPYEGGRVTLFGFGNRGTVLSARESAAWFADQLELPMGREGELATQDDLTAYEQNWSSPHGHVRLITISGGGHTVPQGNYRFAPIVGPTMGSDVILQTALRQLIESGR